MNYERDLHSWQSAYLFKAIKDADGDKRLAARTIGMGTSTFYRRWALVEDAIKGECNGLGPLTIVEDHFKQEREIGLVVARVAALEESFEKRVKLEVARSESLVAEMEQRAMLAEAKHARLLAFKATPRTAEAVELYEAFGI